MNPPEDDNKLVTHYSWYAPPLPGFEANSRTRVRNGGAPLMPPRRGDLAIRTLTSLSIMTLR